jgi:ribonuclease HII
MKMPVELCVDESGTGALAGPFTVTAAAIYTADEPLLRKMGVTDSKKLTDKKRRELIADISDVVLCAHTVVVEAHKSFDPGQRIAWRKAVVDAALLNLKVVSRYSWVVVDGSPDRKLERDFRAAGVEEVHFMTKGDLRHAGVASASIVAKTIRNDLMLALHEDYPEYKWNKNYGYGTAAHKKAIELHGVSDQHRKIKSLAGVKKRVSEDLCVI